MTTSFCLIEHLTRVEAYANSRYLACLATRQGDEVHSSESPSYKAGSNVGETPPIASSRALADSASSPSGLTLASTIDIQDPATVAVLSSSDILAKVDHAPMMHVCWTVVDFFAADVQGAYTWALRGSHVLRVLSSKEIGLAKPFLTVSSNVKPMPSTMLPWKLLFAFSCNCFGVFIDCRYGTETR